MVTATKSPVGIREAQIFAELDENISTHVSSHVVVSCLGPPKGYPEAITSMPQMYRKRPLPHPTRSFLNWPTAPLPQHTRK